MWMLNVYDMYIGVPISDRSIFSIYLMITGIFIFIILYLYVKVIGRLLRDIADKIDEGSISSNPEETMQVMEAIQGFVDKEQRISKYQAC